MVYTGPVLLYTPILYALSPELQWEHVLGQGQRWSSLNPKWGGVSPCTSSGAGPQPRVLTAALGQRGHYVALLELPSSAMLGDKSGAEQSAAAPCKVQGGTGKAEAGGHPPEGLLELVGDTAMLFEEYLPQGECSPFALEHVLALGRGQKQLGCPHTLWDGSISVAGEGMCQQMGGLG